MTTEQSFENQDTARSSLKCRDSVKFLSPHPKSSSDRVHTAVPSRGSGNRETKNRVIRKTWMRSPRGMKLLETWLKRLNVRYRN